MIMIVNISGTTLILYLVNVPPLSEDPPKNEITCGYPQRFFMRSYSHLVGNRGLKVTNQPAPK